MIGFMAMNKQLVRQMAPARAFAAVEQTLHLPNFVITLQA
jgi:hypothetical protein